MQSCQIFFLKKLAQKLGLLLIEGRKVSQRCRLGADNPRDRLLDLGTSIFLLVKQINILEFLQPCVIIYPSVAIFCTIDLE